jgi:hypothetical protein
MSQARNALQDILRQSGRPLRETDNVAITGQDPVLPTNFLLGTAGAAVIAANGLAAADIWELRSGKRQDVTLDMAAAAAALRSDRYILVDGRSAPDPWSPISGFYETGDGRWIQLHCNFPHHRDGVLAVLDCENDREAVASVIATWDGAVLESALAEAQMCAGLVRRPAEWSALPHAKAVADLPLIEIDRIGDSPPEPYGDGARPLSGVRVLDLTRVIAGPVCGRTLAEHGAEVLRIAAPHLPSVPSLVMDTGHGKRSAFLDLRCAEDQDRLRGLVRDADVFSQSYRPNTLASRGFGPEDLAALRPGIVCVTLSAFGHEGPWRNRRGFDSLVQTVSGIAHEGGNGDGDGAPPRHLPAQALDYVGGYLGSLGAMIALARRAREGGSYRVRVSLAQTGRWITELGRTESDARDLHEQTREDAADFGTETDTPFGRLWHMAPVVQLSETPPRWVKPAVPLGTHEPVW